ncbi:MAG: ion transporter [Balneolaceae bacterium]
MNDKHMSDWRHELHEIIFEADTKLGKAFDLVLIVSIILSVIVVMLDSVASLHDKYTALFYSLEWFFTIIFTVEYILRIMTVHRIKGYVFSFYGLVDLFSVLPTYISIIIPGSHYFLIIRLLRVLRIFRVLKFTQYLKEMEILRKALARSRRKIAVFMFTVLTIAFIVGAIMYVVEGPAHGFTSIPRGIYWAVVTLTTVGYGDISPETPLGQMLAIGIMILGYGIIAVPTGIVTLELGKVGSDPDKISTQVCKHCSREGHEADAIYCKFCGYELNPEVV